MLSHSLLPLLLLIVNYIVPFSFCLFSFLFIYLFIIIIIILFFLFFYSGISLSRLYRLRLHVSRYPDIWISRSQRSGYLRGVYTYRIETFSAFTRVQISGCIIRGILAMCRRNTQMPFFFRQVACFQILFHFSFLFLCLLAGRQGQCFVWYVQ